MKDTVKFIRDVDRVFEKTEDGKFVLMQKYPGINAAKKFTRKQPLGTVARSVTIIKENGEKFYKELFS